MSMKNVSAINASAQLQYAKHGGNQATALHLTPRQTSTPAQRLPFGCFPRIFISFFFLLAIAGLASAASYCDSSQLSTMQSYSFVGLVIMAIMIAFVYMLGEFISNPKLLVWAKVELVQLFASVIIVGLVIALLSITCFVQVGGLIGLTNFNPNPSYLPNSPTTGAPVFSQTDLLLNASESYVMAVRDFDHAVLSQIRYNMGVIELRAGTTKWNCELLCLLGGQGTSVAQYSGEYSILSMFGMLMNMSTASYLSSIFMLFTLHFITDGLFGLLLPLGILLRSLPYMRGVGGALIALVLAMYVFYPAMLVVDSLLWMPVYNSAVVPSNALMGTAAYINSQEADLNGGLLTFDNPYQSPVQLVMLSGVAFLASAFLPAINFIIIAALARTASHILGEEIDISRLAQMV